MNVPSIKSAIHEQYAHADEGAKLYQKSRGISFGDNVCWSRNWHPARPDLRLRCGTQGPELLLVVVSCSSSRFPG